MDSRIMRIAALAVVALFVMNVASFSGSPSDAEQSEGEVSFEYCVGVSYCTLYVLFDSFEAQKAVMTHSAASLNNFTLKSISLDSKDVKVYSDYRWSEYERWFNDQSGSAPAPDVSASTLKNNTKYYLTGVSSVKPTYSFEYESVVVTVGMDGTTDSSSTTKNGTYSGETVYATSTLTSSYANGKPMRDYPLEMFTFYVDNDNSKVTVDLDVKGKATAKVHLTILSPTVAQKALNRIGYEYGYNNQTPGEYANNKIFDAAVAGGSSFGPAVLMLDSGLYVAFLYPSGFGDEKGTFTATYSTDGVVTSNTDGNVFAFSGLAVSIVLIGLLVTFPLWYRKIVLKAE